MTHLKDFDKIYNDIISNKINRSIGLEQFFLLLRDSHNKEIELEIIEILNNLITKYKDLVELLMQILILDENQFIKLIIAKTLIQNHIHESSYLIEKQLKSGSSAYFVTSLYQFLDNKDLELYKRIKKIIIDTYRKIYNIVFEEAKFFLDLETTLIESSNQFDFKLGYFIKFKADNMQIFKNDNHRDYLIKDSHIIALDLSRLEMKEIPKSIGCLSKLHSLKLANLELEDLPESIQLLSQLKYLDLSGNKFRKIPKWLIDFIEKKFSQKYVDEGVDPVEAKVLSIIEILKGIKLEKANIENEVIHWEVALNYKLNKAGNIIGLYLDDEKTGIGIFPKILCSLENLQELILSNSSIENIPSCIGELQSLKYLDLSFNRIRTIPKSINTLKNLEYLNLFENEIPERTFLSLRWNKTGQIYIDKGEYEKAIVECKDTLEVYPRNKTAWFYLGRAYKERGDYSLAEDAFQRFLQIDPISPVVLGYLSDIYHDKGEFSKAIYMIKQALEIEPNVALLWSNLGFNFKKFGKYDKAIDAYLHSLEINPKNRNIWKELASIYRDKGDYMKAIEADEKALEIELNYEENDIK